MCSCAHVLMCSLSGYMRYKMFENISDKSKLERVIATSIKNTHVTLVLGSSNIPENMLKTNGFVQEALDRYDPHRTAGRNTPHWYRCTGYVPDMLSLGYELQLLQEYDMIQEKILYIEFIENDSNGFNYTVKKRDGTTVKDYIPVADIKNFKPKASLDIEQLNPHLERILNITAKRKHTPCGPYKLNELSYLEQSSRWYDNVIYRNSKVIPSFFGPFDARVAKGHQVRAGNCGTQCILLASYLWHWQSINRSEPLIHTIEIISLSGIDHTVVLVNRNKSSTLDCPDAWDGWIVDPWQRVDSDFYYHSSLFNQKMATLWHSIDTNFAVTTFHVIDPLNEPYDESMKLVDLFPPFEAEIGMTYIITRLIYQGFETHQQKLRDEIIPELMSKLNEEVNPPSPMGSI